MPSSKPPTNVPVDAQPSRVSTTAGRLNERSALPPAIPETTIDIEIKNEDILTFEGDGIVVPTFSGGQMAEGIAARIKAAAGDDVELEAVEHAPIAVGAALVSIGGTLKVKYLIHAPLIEQPGLRVGVENIRRATRAGLLAATHYRMESIAIPGMGYDEMGVPHDEAARAIIDEVRGYKGTLPTRVTLLDADPEMYDSFLTEFGEP